MKSNESAFPQHVPTGMCQMNNDGKITREFQAIGGLSKREYIAIKAMAALLQAESVSNTSAIVIKSYEIADKMIIASTITYGGEND